MASQLADAPISQEVPTQPASPLRDDSDYSSSDGEVATPSDNEHDVPDRSRVRPRWDDSDSDYDAPAKVRRVEALQRRCPYEPGLYTVASQTPLSEGVRGPTRTATAADIAYSTDANLPWQRRITTLPPTPFELPKLEVRRADVTEDRARVITTTLEFLGRPRTEIPLHVGYDDTTSKINERIYLCVIDYIQQALSVNWQADDIPSQWYIVACLSRANACMQNAQHYLTVSLDWRIVKSASALAVRMKEDLARFGDVVLKLPHLLSYPYITVKSKIWVCISLICECCHFGFSDEHPTYEYLALLWLTEALRVVNTGMAEYTIVE